MKAAIYDTYGAPDVLQLTEVATPEPKENEVLIRVHATTVTSVDATFRKGDSLFPRMATGLTKPKVPTLGTELSGVIEAVGEKVTQYQVGDAVIAEAGTHYGAHAEYICLPEDAPMVLKPVNLSFEEAAAVPYGALTALPFLRDHGKIKKGDKVLINGASGSVGTYAVQLAKYFGAEVTGVCSTANMKLVQSLGADRVIDYKNEDFTQEEDAYDIIFDTVGKSSFPQVKRSLKSHGVYLTTVLGLPILYQMGKTSLLGNKKAILALTGLRKPEEMKQDLNFIQELLESGQIKPVIDRSYPLDQIDEAHRYVDSGHKKGNVVILVSGSR